MRLTPKLRALQGNAARVAQTAARPWRRIAPGGEYQVQVNANVAAGRRPAYINAFMESGVPKISAIWNQFNTGSWVARHGLTSAQYQTEYNTWTAQGLLVRDVTGYENGGSARFAVLFTSAPGAP